MTEHLSMTPEIYENKRNGLIGILENIISKSEGLPNETKTELEETIGKLKRNSFEIVLVGEFQGGKSTVFDTICDGREISPRGIGIKTSACKISAQSIPQDIDEYADLRWKSDNELMLTMLGIVKDNLVNEKEAKVFFTAKDEKGNDVIPSLADAKVREIAMKAIHCEWEKYKSAPDKYDTGRLDLLQISTLILKFYNTDELSSLRSKTKVTIEELKPLVVFPRDWANRWLKGGENAEWAFQKIPFVFLANVSCYIHCENLERLGCVITDCPGLFAGPWDTAVAQHAMMQADAILYLIRGDRTVTEADLRALSEIRKTQQGHKVFFAINARSSHENIATNLRPEDFSMIKQRGFNLEEPESIDVFNALIAYDSKTLSKDAKTWGKEVSYALALYLGLDLTDDDDIAKAKALRENLSELYAISDFASIIEKIETSIISRKFESILVKGGTEKASGALKILEGDLKQKEDAAAKDLKAIEQEAKEARKKLDEFQDFVKETIATELDNTTAAEQTANDFFRSVYEENVEELGSCISATIAVQFQNSEDLKNLSWSLLRSKLPGAASVDNANDVAETVLQEPIEEAMNSILKPATEGWISTLRDNQNEMFNLAYGRALDRVCMMVREKWDSTYSADAGFLTGLAPDIDWDISRVVISNSEPVIGTVNVEEEALRMLRSKILSNILGPILGILGSLIVGVLVAVFTGIILTDGILIIMAITSSAAFAKWFSEKVSSQFLARLRPSITEKLREVFSHDRKTITESFKTTVLKGIVEEIKERCQKSLQKQLDAFNRRVEETLAMKRKSHEEQKRIATLAQKVREEQIIPAQKEIETFFNDLSKYFG